MEKDYRKCKSCKYWSPVSDKGLMGMCSYGQEVTGEFQYYMVPAEYICTGFVDVKKVLNKKGGLDMSVYIEVLGKVVRNKKVIGYRLYQEGYGARMVSVKDAIRLLKERGVESNAVVVEKDGTTFLRLKSGRMEEMVLTSEATGVVQGVKKYKIEKDKYRMTRDQNVFVVKRKIIDYIWKSALLEGLSVTFPQTEAVYNGVNAKGLRVEEVLIINNLKKAWWFLLDNLDYPTDYPFVCEINRQVGYSGVVQNAGFIRTMPVSITGTDWVPDVPVEHQIKEEIIEIMLMENATDRAITMMLYLMRKQMFLDGNKRTAMFAANHIMVSNGVGVITIPTDLRQMFSEKLVRFYETGNMSDVKKFVYEKCIDGIKF